MARSQGWEADRDEDPPPRQANSETSAACHLLITKTFLEIGAATNYRHKKTYILLRRRAILGTSRITTEVTRVSGSGRAATANNAAACS